MQKEKQVRSYKRRTKSGKIITVRSHTAKYEAADKTGEISKKKGAGKELEERKKKPVQLEIPFGKEEEKKVLDEVKETAKKESSKKPAEKKTTDKGTRRASGAKLNEDGTFVSEKDYKKSIAHRKKKGARISPEEVKAIKKWEAAHKEEKVRPVGSGTVGPTPKRKSEAKVGDYVKGVGSLSTGKVVRAKSDIPAKLAKSYAESERIPLKQAYQELMVASKREYKMISSFHNGGTISPKKARPVGSGTNGSTPIKTSTSTSSPTFTAAEFKEWYRGTGSAADKKVAKALRAQLGRAGYRKLEDEAIDNYSSRGHLSMFKRVGGGSSASTGTKSTTTKKSKSTTETAASLRERADKMDAAVARANRKKSLDTLKSKGYTRYGDFYFKPSKEGSINGSYMRVSSNGTMRSLAPFEKEGAKSTVARKIGKKYTPKPVK